jgi:hypothetical protein
MKIGTAPIGSIEGTQMFTAKKSRRHPFPEKARNAWQGLVLERAACRVADRCRSAAEASRQSGVVD